MSIKVKNLFRICPICSATVGEVFHTQYFTLPENYQLPKFYDIVCCEICGFVYADVKATQKDFDTFYEEQSKYEDETTASGGNFNPYDRERFQKVAIDISRFLPDKRSKVLDIGCANGGLLGALKDKDYENLIGIDPSPICVSNVVKEGFRAAVGTVFSGGFFGSDKKQDFDCILLSHVLEHIYDLKPALKNVLTRLKVGGIMYLEVPDASCYSDFYKVPYYYFDYEHINHFDENSLRNILFQFSLECVTLTRKEIPVSTCELYPAVYAVFRKTTSQHLSQKVVFSPVVRDSIIKYVEMSQKDPVFDQLNEIVESQEKIIVWGAGCYTSRLLSNTPLGKGNIVDFVDNDIKKQGLSLKGVKIYPPEILRDYQGTIVVSSALHSSDIVEEIKGMGLKNKVIVLR